MLIWQREQLRWGGVDGGKGERDWQGLVQRAKERGLREEGVPVRSEDGLYIIYTSGKHWTKRSTLAEM